MFGNMFLGEQKSITLLLKLYEYNEYLRNQCWL